MFGTTEAKESTGRKPTRVGVVADDDLAVLPVSPSGRELEAYGLLHGAQMHGQVRGVGHEASVGTEDGAAEVQSFLDVGADRGPLQGPPHLFSDTHEAVTEQRQLDAVELLGHLVVVGYRSVWLG